MEGGGSAPASADLSAAAGMDEPVVTVPSVQPGSPGPGVRRSTRGGTASGRAPNASPASKMAADAIAALAWANNGR
jgi:hypothetical protein